jgi:tripartite-type tricarboxylate transporter receptor subunit TctC
MPHIKTGKVRALGVASRERSEELPDLPTLAEQLKTPVYDITSVFAVMAPAATPRPVVNKLHTDIVRALALPEVRQSFKKLGATSPPPLSPEETLAKLRAESVHWGKVLRTANITGKQ